MAGVGGADCTDPGLGAGLEFALDGGRTKPSAELVRMIVVDAERTVSWPLGLAAVTTSDFGTSAPAGLGVRTINDGSEAGTEPKPKPNVWIFTADGNGCCCA